MAQLRMKGFTRELRCAQGFGWGRVGRTIKAAVEDNSAAGELVPEFHHLQHLVVVVVRVPNHIQQVFHLAPGVIMR